MATAIKAQQPKLMLPLAHTSRITDIDFSPDGKKFVTAANDNTAKIWETNSGILIADLLGHSSWVSSAAYSPDGERILTASMDNIVKIWDANSGRLIANLKEHSYLMAPGYLAGASFSPDGKKIVTCYLDSVAKIWDAKTGNFIVDLKGKSSRFYSAQFSPDCNQIITRGSDSIVQTWDVFSGNLLNNFSGQIKSNGLAEFSPDGKKILTNLGPFVKLWDAITGKMLVTIEHSSHGRSAQFSPEGKKIVTVSEKDSMAKIWDVNTGALIAELRGHLAPVTSAVFSPDGQNIVTTSFDLFQPPPGKDNTAKVWDAHNGNLVADFKDNIGGVTVAQFSPDSKKLAIASGGIRRSNIIKMWDLQNTRLGYEIGKNKVNSPMVAFSPDSKNIILNSNQTKTWNIHSGHFSSFFKGRFKAINADGTLVITRNSSDTSMSIWDTKIGSVVKIFRDVDEAVFVPGGGIIAVSSVHDTSTHIWDINSDKELMKFKGELSSINSNGKKIIALSSDSIARIWDIQSGILLGELNQFPSNYYATEFSSDGSKLLVFPNGPNSNRNKDYTPKIWDAVSGKLIADLKGHLTPITAAHFSSDGEKIVTGSLDGIVKVWETVSGKCIADLKGHTLLVECAQFSLDSKRIITSSIDNTTKIWDSQTGVEIMSLAGKSSGFDNNLISSYGKKIVTVQGDSHVNVWDSQTGNLVVNLKGYAATIDKAQFFPDGKRIVSSSSQGFNNIWNAETGKLLYTLFNIDSSDYLIIDQYNRYDGTEKARKLLYFTCGTEVIELDQVKDQLWVPNLAERIMKGDSINAKSLDELNICGLTPEVQDSSFKSDEYYFKILPRRGGLGETVLYLNGIEVKRYKPNELKTGRGRYELKIKKAVLKDLFVAGKENTLTVKAFTSDNAISSRGLKVSEDKSKEKATPPNLFAVMVGVSDYKGDELDLKYPGKDASDMSAVVANAAKNLLNTDGTEHVFMYNLTTNKDYYQLPEKKSIKKVLEEIGTKATANDILLIFFAGHGVMSGSENSKQFYFLTADASLNSSLGAVAEVGISTSELTEWIKPANIKAQKRIMIFDACNSGQAIKDFVSLGNKDQGYVAARSDEKGQEIKAIEKLNNQSGLFILSASASNMAAYEMDRYSQGLLTYSLLKAVKQQPDILNEGKYLDVNKWFNAARETVSEVSKETGARQDPQIVSNTNFNIGVVNEEVMAKIVLSNEKPLFAACNFQNADENNPVDNLGLNKLIDQQLNRISSRGTDAPIVYAGITSSAAAYSLSGRYNITGNAITIKVFIIQNKEVKQKIDLTGTKDKLNEFTALIATEAAAWAEKNK